MKMLYGNEITIEQGVPIPDHCNEEMHKIADAISAMEIGQSFKLELPHANAVTAVQGTLHAACHLAYKKSGSFNTGAMPSVYVEVKTDVDGPKPVYIQTVWRTG